MADNRVIEIQPPLAIIVGDRRYPIRSLAEASAMFCAVRDAAGVGGSQTPRVTIAADGLPLGYVSYNGRIWAGRPEEWQPGQKPIYDPYQGAR